MIMQRLYKKKVASSSYSRNHVNALSLTVHQRHRYPEIRPTAEPSTIVVHPNNVQGNGFAPYGCQLITPGCAQWPILGFCPPLMKCKVAVQPNLNGEVANVASSKG